MKWLLLGVQGGFVGYVAGLAFPGFGWDFVAVLFVNAALVTWYGISTRFEKNC